MLHGQGVEQNIGDGDYSAFSRLMVKGNKLFLKLAVLQQMLQNLLPDARWENSAATQHLRYTLYFIHW